MTSRSIFVESSLGEDALFLRRASHFEALGSLSELSLELLCDENTAPRMGELLGTTITLHATVADGGTRYVHGYVTELAETGESGRYLHTHATVRPWLWFLSRSSNCRIFQDKTVPEIVREVCQDHGFTDIRDALQDNYHSWEYVVQYRESDFAFISRLLEQEGIYYFFEHEQAKHTMVLADGPKSHKPAPNYETVPYRALADVADQDLECLHTWQVQHQVQTGAYVLDDYDFKRPRAALQVKLQAARSHPHSRYEVYDYPGEYTQTQEGESYVKVRLEELQAQFERASGTGNTRGLTAGGLFSLSAHPRDDQNQEYLVTQSQFQVDLGDYDSGGAQEQSFRCSIEAMKTTASFRSRRVTPRPVISGHQTAKVVGKAGEEIWTDEFGRVKVQFPWDRKGASNESSSCWMRVAQVWAGSGWGAMHVPRIGQEVLVSFLEGDPDRPIVTGRVYNGNAMPPFELPAKAMVSGTKSESTPGGGGYNEISMDDTKGVEKIIVHGQFDMESTIEHDKKLLVGNNRTSVVGVNDTESVGQNQTITVGANQALTIAALSDDVVGISKTLTIGVDYQVTVGGAMNETVAGLKAEEVGGTKSLLVGADSSEHVKGGKTVKTDKSSLEEAKEAIAVKSGKTMTLTAGEDFAVHGKKKGLIEIADELTLKVGSATITLKKNGDIVINGKKISVTGSGDVVMKGKKVSQN
ncbi:MAG: type secretion system Vgr family protein [Myxococcaceae bacterium]|nr:type secretion system Vgr family protein [Myxococcaceae bacterium]